MYKRAGIITVVVIMLVIAMNILVNRIILGIDRDAAYEETPASVQKASDPKKVVRPPEEKKSTKITNPEDLEKYGITITPRLAGPSTAEEWQAYVEANLKKSKAMETPQGQEVIRSMQVSEAEYSEKMKNLDEHVQIIKERLDKDPFDKKNKEKLQNIYKLQAVGRALKNRVTVPDDKFIANILTSESSMPSESTAGPSQ